MTTFHWFLPTTGAGDQVGAATVAAGAAAHVRTPTVAYLSEVARAAEKAGFDSALTPIGAGCLDARLDEYTAVGVDEFILSGWPHLEEAGRVGAAIRTDARSVPA